jgi:hypothetical protein
MSFGVTGGYVDCIIVDAPVGIICDAPVIWGAYALGAGPVIWGGYPGRIPVTCDA